MLKTSITRVDEKDIVVRGRRLAEDLVGKISFSDFFFLHAMGREPTPQESALFGAVLVNSMDHGINQPVLLARLAYGTGPESIQGAIAAGILGVGSVVDGAIETAAQVLNVLAAEVDNGSTEEEAVAGFLAERLAKKEPVAGFGHPLHKETDPRVATLFQLIEENGFSGRFVRLLQEVSRQMSAQKGRDVPVNGAGAVAAVYCELGFPAPIAKAATIVALAAGVTGHLMEEMQKPMARDIRKLVSQSVQFDG